MPFSCLALKAKSGEKTNEISGKSDLSVRAIKQLSIGENHEPLDFYSYMKGARDLLILLKCHGNIHLCFAAYEVYFWNY